MFRFRRNDKEFEELTRPLGAVLYRLAYWRLGNKQDAEDALQETYLRAFRSFHTFRRGSNARAWLTTILFNVISDTLKKRGRQPDALYLDDDSDIIEKLESASQSLRDPEEQMIDKEIDGDLMRALKMLPSNLLNPLLLREIEELTYQEIATQLDMPLGTVMSRLFRARQVLKSRLAPEQAGGKKAKITKELGDGLQ